MEQPPTLGLIFRPEHPIELLPDIARQAERVGLDQLWLWEDCFEHGVIAAATAALATTSRLTVALGVAPVPLRNPALTAMEFAAIARLFPDRFVPGIGHGVQSWMSQVGAQVASPIGLLTEYVDALNQFLSGAMVSVDGKYVRLDRVQLAQPPTVPPPLAMSARRPRTLAITGRYGDITVLASPTTPDEVAQARRAVADARAAAGRPGEPVIAVYLVAATGPDARRRVEQELEDRAADLPDLAALGAAAEMASSVRRFAEAGADIVVLQPTADEPDMAGLVDQVGQVHAIVTGSN